MFLRMRQLRWLTIATPVALVLTIYGHGRAQSEPVPNLSGTWKLVEMDGNKDYRNKRFPKMTLVIEHESEVLKVTEMRSRHGKDEVRTFIYHTDGRGDTTGRVELWRSKDRDFESVTRTEKGRIVTQYKPELYMGTGYPSVDTSSKQTDLWSLDGAGTTLTLTTKSLDIRSAMMVGISGAQSGSRPTEWSTFKLKFRRIRSRRE